MLYQTIGMIWKMILMMKKMRKIFLKKPNLFRIRATHLLLNKSRSRERLNKPSKKKRARRDRCGLNLQSNTKRRSLQRINASIESLKSTESQKSIENLESRESLKSLQISILVKNTNVRANYQTKRKKIEKRAEWTIWRKLIMVFTIKRIKTSSLM